MRVLADENVDGALVKWMRDHGHDVIWAAEEGAGQSDVHWINVAVAEQRVLFTFDLDFGEQVMRKGRSVPGLVLLRLHGRSTEALLDRIAHTWAMLEQQATGRFMVVGPTSIRVRPMPEA